MNFPSNFKEHIAAPVFAETADTHPAFKIYFIGDQTLYPDPQVVMGTSTWTFYLNYTTGAVKDTDVGTAGDIDMDGADYTIAALIAALVTSGKWLIVPVGCLEVLTGTAADDLNFGTLWDESASGVELRVIEFAADSANAVNCRNATGTIVCWDTSQAIVHSACVGLEALGAAHGLGPSRQMHKTILTPRQSDVSNRPAAGSQGTQFQPQNRCAVIDRLFVINASDAGGAVSADFIEVWACGVDGEGVPSVRKLADFAGPGDNAGNLTTSANITYMSKEGERLVVFYHGTNVGDAANVTKVNVNGAIGQLQR